MNALDELRARMDWAAEDVARLVADAPPLPPATRARLAALLATSGNQVAK
ncbi:hypothetical protein [Georgenia deserti]|uniref:MarR family transcriptional regulator n=1 Tax=Georgenia deserti TaxID=2093781 RepID=A0ABW4L149_9MICO